MILWLIKLLSTLRRAIAGRKYPHQLAWAVAFGLLLGVVPHGNLLAVALLVVVLSLKINHAMAGLTAVVATFLATQLDPISHEVGDYVLTHPGFRETAASAWQLPLMPWTDLNNTVVMGSFVIGVAALLPTFVISYPLFRFIAPEESDLPEESDVHDGGDRVAARRNHAAGSNKDSHQVVIVDRAHIPPAAPHHDRASTPAGAVSSDRPKQQHDVDFVEVDGQAPASQGEDRVAVETRIDVIRMKDYRSPEDASSRDDASDPQQPMDEALNYLLRQLRDSQQRKAA